MSARAVLRLAPARLNPGRMFPLAAMGAVTLLLLAAGARTIELQPHVNENFFFSSDDPRFRADQKIRELFPHPPQVIISVQGDVRAASYQARIGALTRDLASLPPVYNVQSLTRGPSGLDDAFKSPIWKRLLVIGDGEASNLFVFVEDVPPEDVVPDIEAITDGYEQDGFRIVISGVPYVMELIRRNLTRDLRVFSTATLLLFGVTVLFLFRSYRLALGTLCACIQASVLTLLATQACGITLGLLTANLVTIVSVLTLAHLIFLSSNWLGAASGKRWEAVRLTLPGSFWSMATTMLGFGSLLFVPAEPLRTLGISGAVATVLAFLVAFLGYPWLLDDTRMRKLRAEGSRGGAVARRVMRRDGWIALGVGAACLAGGAGLWRIDTDPSLLAYFAKGSELRTGLEYVDRHLGSSPLKIVVRDPQGGRFNTETEYQRLWDLHHALERDEAVGTVVSLPLIMAEARRAPLAFLLPWEWLLNILELPQFDRIGTQFVTRDRARGLFVLLMREGGRGESRPAVIDRLTETVRRHRFEPELLGGVYLLQGAMARMLVSSLSTGVLLLLALFGMLGFGLTRSWRVTAALVLAVAVIPVCLLGLIGHAGMVFDVISAPAANLAMAMGIDAMLHVLIAVRHARAGGAGEQAAWREARVRLWRPIVSTTVIVSLGFGVFGLSAFPPTQRFGLSITGGTLVAPFAAWVVLPWLARNFRRLGRAARRASTPPAARRRARHA